MKYNLVEKTYEAEEIDAPTASEWLDATGCDSVCYVMTATDADTPGTASIQLQGSLDKSSAVNVGSSVSVAADGVFTASVVDPVFKYYRISYAIASGSFTSTLKALFKGDKAG